MEQVKVIEKMISLVALSPEEQLALVKLLIAKWKLKQEDCFAEKAKRRERKPKVVSETDEVKELKRRGRKEPKHLARKPKVVSETDEVKEPKRRGRPKKNKAVDGIVDEAKIPKTLNYADEALIEASKNCRDGRKLLEDDEPVVIKTNSKRNKAFLYYSDYPELKKQILGPKQEFALLYKWKSKLLLSHYILTEMMPMGVYVPYKSKMFGKYLGFVIYLYDEKVMQNVNKAIGDAKSWSLVDDENWGVMDSLQWCTIRPMLAQINRLLSKVGGDGFRGSYQTVSPNSTLSSGVGKIRYTVNVK